jgi:hypothetical protein
MAASAGLANQQSAIGFQRLAAVEEDAMRSAVVAEDGSEQITSRAACIDDGLELRKVIGSSDSSRLRGRESRSWFC